VLPLLGGLDQRGDIVFDESVLVQVPEEQLHCDEPACDRRLGQVCGLSQCNHERLNVADVDRPDVDALIGAEPGQ